MCGERLSKLDRPMIGSKIGRHHSSFAKRRP
jgi:hypothetical protein